MRRYMGQKKGLAVMKRCSRGVAHIRALGEHALRVLKCPFGYPKTRYQGLDKNGAQLTTPFALANLYLLMRHLLAARSALRPKSADGPQIARISVGNPSLSGIFVFRKRSFSVQIRASLMADHGVPIIFHE